MEDTVDEILVSIGAIHVAKNVECYWGNSAKAKYVEWMGMEPKWGEQVCGEGGIW